MNSFMILPFSRTPSLIEQSLAFIHAVFFDDVDGSVQLYLHNYAPDEVKDYTIALG